MSILNKNTTTATTTEESKSTQEKTVEEIVQLLDNVSDSIKCLRTADRQVKRLNSRLDDLQEDKIDTRALRRTKADLADLDIAGLKSDADKLETDLSAAETDPDKVTEAALRAFRRRSAKLQGQIEETTAIIKEAEEIIKAAEDKADADDQPQSDPETIVVTETDDQKLGANIWAVSMLPEYKTAGCPKLKTPDGKEIVFCLPVERPSGTKYVRLDPQVADKEDLPDLVAGYFDKKKFVPLSGETGSRAKALAVLVNSSRLW